jgi:hypothetical protein
MKPMSPTRLANKVISNSPWTNRNLYTTDLAHRTPRSNRAYSRKKDNDASQNPNDMDIEKIPTNSIIEDKMANSMMNEENLNGNRQDTRYYKIVPKLMLNGGQLADYERGERAEKIVEKTHQTHNLPKASHKPHPISHITSNELNLIDPSLMGKPKETLSVPHVEIRLSKRLNMSSPDKGSVRGTSTYNLKRVPNNHMATFLQKKMLIKIS